MVRNFCVIVGGEKLEIYLCSWARVKCRAKLETDKKKEQQFHLFLISLLPLMQVKENMQSNVEIMGETFERTKQNCHIYNKSPEYQMYNSVPG